MSKKMPDHDDRSADYDEARDPEDGPAWDEERSGPEWTDADDARVDREGY